MNDVWTETDAGPAAMLGQMRVVVEEGYGDYAVCFYDTDGLLAMTAEDMFADLWTARAEAERIAGLLGLELRRIET